MYKNNGNCVCFITSEKRMHAWLKAVAHILYYDLGNKPNNNVIWRDRTEKSSIVHTECIVSDNTVGLDSGDDDFVYKVIFYLTTGKIMIQGKGYDLFCGQIFKECFRLVNEYLDSDTSVKLAADHNTSPSSVPEMNSDKDETLPKGLVTQDKHDDVLICTQTSTENPANSSEKNSKGKPGGTQQYKPIIDILVDAIPATDDETVISDNKLTSYLTPLVNRLDVMEDSLFKITDMVSKHIENQNDSKNQLTLDFKTLSDKIKVATKHPCSTSHIFDSQIKEKDKIINQLKGQLEESQLINSNIEADLKTHHDVEIKELESEIQRLRTEKITIQMENEQLDNSLKCMEDTNKKLKSIYDERLNDKD